MESLELERGNPLFFFESLIKKEFKTIYYGNQKN
jgi:hypothetical protein